MNGLETDGELTISTIATAATTINKQIQPQSAEEQQRICRYCEKPGHFIKECLKCIRRKQKRQGEKTNY